MANKTNRNPAEIPLRHPTEHWKAVFQKYDRDRDGKINFRELDDIINSREYESDIPEHVVRRIHEKADTDGDGFLDFNEFVAMVNRPELQPIFGHLLNRYIRILLPRRRDETQIDGLYEDEYTCCPPPVGMILISLIEIVFYSIDAAKGNTTTATGPMAAIFIYDPQKRYEAWRYITYMFVHIGVMHLVVNLCVQILLGIPLEMVHRWWRILVIYFAGVAAGSLGTSITDPTVKLAGASGGVYALITAHMSTIIMNWREMEFPFVQLAVFLIIAGCDVGTAIYNRYVLDVNEQIGYAAHFAGAIAGLLVGINILRNINVTRTERVIWWVSIITYAALMATAIIWNAAYTDYFPRQDFNKY